MSKFEVGHRYGCADSGFHPILILYRTDKQVCVDNGTFKFRMMIRTDEKGNEWVRDSSYPKKWQNAMSYYSWLDEGVCNEALRVMGGKDSPDDPCKTCQKRWCE